jgi:hypothetical protein
MVALEEFCIYGNAHHENVEKLRTLNVSKLAAHSLQSSNTSIVVRSLSLASILCFNSKKACETVVENGAMGFILSDGISSCNDYY